MLTRIGVFDQQSCTRHGAALVSRLLQLKALLCCCVLMLGAVACGSDKSGDGGGDHSGGEAGEVSTGKSGNHAGGATSGGGTGTGDAGEGGAGEGGATAQGEAGAEDGGADSGGSGGSGGSVVGGGGGGVGPSGPQVECVKSAGQFVGSIADCGSVTIVNVAPTSLPAPPNATDKIAAGVTLDLGGQSSSGSGTLTVVVSASNSPNSTPIAFPVTGTSLAAPIPGIYDAGTGTFTFPVTSGGTYVVIWQDRTVLFESFEVNPATGWQVDNSQKQEGTKAAHPPALADLGKASFNFTCNGTSHSQLKFWYLGVNPAAGQKLSFYVDDVPYQTYGISRDASGNYNQWQQVILTVPSGKHTYRWDASVDVAGQPPYWLDALRCLDVPVANNTTGRFNFEEGFVPPETTGGFTIDNSQRQEGSLSAHPPLLKDLGKSALNFSCGARSHSQLTFWYLGVNPAAGQKLNFYVDDVLYQTYGISRDASGNYNQWQQVILTVPSGKHTYRWDALVDTAGQPPYWLDALRCVDVPVVKNATGRFNFEEGFVPPEVTGSFTIDNSQRQEGTLSAHPPLLKDLGKSSLDFSCGAQSHSQLTFWYLGVNPATGQQLNFYVDDVLYHAYGISRDASGNYNQWQQVILTVPSGTHTYRWDATVDIAGQPPYWLDAIRCLDAPIAANTTGRFNFEEGFVPPEVTGGFVIDNSQRQDGSFSAHPPLLKDLGKSTLNFSCGAQSHSQLTFWYLGVNPTATQPLNFYVDGTLYQAYGISRDASGNYNQWQQVILTVPSGQHTYRWDATVDTAGQPPYWLDAIRCLDVPIAANTTGRFNFEEGFVPPEVTGGFVIDNSQRQDGSFSAHPPLLKDLGKSTLNFACGAQSHSQLTFWYLGVNPTATQPLNFYVDGVLYRAYGISRDASGNYNQWQQVILTVPSGTHTYRWDATVDTAGQPPYWLDAIRCLDVPIATNTTGRFNFEEGFVPPEVTGGFVVDNSQRQEGSFSAHPPLLKDLGKSTLNFSCGAQSHNQLTFWYLGVNPTATQQLNFYVDSTLYQAYGISRDASGNYNQWQQVILTVPSGQHSYRWDATVDTASQPPYWLDAIRCQAAP